MDSSRADTSCRGRRVTNRKNMTSTSFNVGLQDNTRLSSRVLRPPGGGHTDIFGGEPEPTRGRRPAPSVLAAAAAQAEEAAKATNGTEPAEPVQPSQNGQQSPVAEPPAQPEPTPAPAPAVTKPDKLDSPPQSQPQAQPEPRAEPPKRVRVPPGGFSSGLW